jgi:hypothetical protein
VSSFLPVFAGAAFVNRKVYTAFSPFTHPLILPQRRGQRVDAGRTCRAYVVSSRLLNRSAVGVYVQVRDASTCGRTPRCSFAVVRGAVLGTGGAFRATEPAPPLALRSAYPLSSQRNDGAVECDLTGRRAGGIVARGADPCENAQVNDLCINNATVRAKKGAVRNA